jgi:hypothetical protein
MARYKVNPDTVTSSGLNFRSAPLVHPSTLRGALDRGDFVESLAAPEVQPPIAWLNVRVLYSRNFPAGAAGYVAMTYAGEPYLVETSDPVPQHEQPVGPSGPTLPEATARAAQLLRLPALLLKAYMGVEGANVNHRDGVLQVTPATRLALIPRIPRPIKLAALDLEPSSIADGDLHERLAQAFAARHLVVQLIVGGWYIREQLARFDGLVALAGLAYNAGPGGARGMVNQFGGDLYHTALQYHKAIGPGPNDVTVQPPVEAVDGATGVKWMRYPVTANDTGIELFQYLYLRQVPTRNYGLLDFLFRPALLANRGLFEEDPPAGQDAGDRALVVSNGRFGFVAG